MFEMIFENFSLGLLSLFEVSQSAAQAVSHRIEWRDWLLNLFEETASDAELKVHVIGWLVKNEADDQDSTRFCGCHVSFDAENEETEGVVYRTSGGLYFGWEPADAGGYKFYVVHPAGTPPSESALRKSALEVGWQEVPAPAGWYYVDADPYAGNPPGYIKQFRNSPERVRERW